MEHHVLIMGHHSSLYISLVHPQFSLELYKISRGLLSAGPSVHSSWIEYVRIGTSITYGIPIVHLVVI